MNDRGLMRDSGTTSGYWYPGHFPEPVDVLNLLRRYREAERRMRLRTRGSMGMGETDLIAVRLLLRRHQAGQLMRQRDLASALEITAASASALVDRLVKSGHARRVPGGDARTHALRHRVARPGRAPGRRPLPRRTDGEPGRADR